MSEPIHLVCTHCSAINRIPSTRLEDGPKCGSCRQPLFQGRPFELDGAGFEKHINNNGVPTVVDFWAAWCGPCKMMAPAFADAATALEPRARLAKLNTEEHPAIASRYGIRSIPTMILFRHGREVARQAGAMGAADIARWVEANL